jgi:hypothetical protein
MSKIIKKKKFKRLFISLYILSFLILFSILVRGITKTSAWYNSSWLYRAPITITGDGTSYTDADVLVSLDTSSLITASKLQSNCADLIFTASDGSTLLNFWIEGGCNSTTTQIWVRVPSVSSTSTDIYVYYGNSLATSAEQSWSGNFISLSDQSSCATGWTRLSAFDSRFPRGSTSYGGTSGSNTHTHSSPSASTNSAGGSTTVQDGVGWGSTVSPGGSHTHSASASLTSGVDHTPPYINMLFCGKNKLDIESNHITMFDVSSFTGWTRYSLLDNRMPRGASTSIGVTGGSSAHSHTVNLSISNRSGSDTIGPTCTANCHYAVVANHGHSVSSTSTTGNNTPAYRNVVFMKKNSSGTLSTENPIYMTNTSTLPPYGWSSFTGFASRIPRGSTSYGSAGGSDSHSHSGSRTSGGTSTVAALWWDSGNFNAITSHTHNVSWSSGTSGNLPPYINTVFMKRNSSLSTSVGTEENSNSSPTSPTNPFCEGATNPKNVTDTTPEFSALFQDPDTGDTGEYYEIEVNTASDFSGTVMWDSGKQSMTSTAINARSPDISYAGTSLSTDGSLYYWRIKFTDNHNTEGPWSSIQNFRMQRQPGQPTALLTDGGSNPEFLDSLTPSFSAIYNDLNEHSATAYEIEVNTASNFLGTVMWDSGKVSTSITEGDRSPDYTYAGTSLSNSGNTYYWRIRFWDADDLTGDWSDVASFDDYLNSQQFEGLHMEGIRVD